MSKQPNASAHPNDLVLERIIEASPEAIFKAWTDPKMLKEWFVPKPWTLSDVKLDVRTGGSNSFVMNGPDGEKFPNAGVYLEVVPNEKIVFTDAYTTAWVPSDKPFFTAIVTFQDIGGGKTKYTAIARHWREEDRETHVKMGFHEGWGQCADQLAELVAKK